MGKIAEIDQILNNINRKLLLLSDSSQTAKTNQLIDSILVDVEKIRGRLAKWAKQDNNHLKI